MSICVLLGKGPYLNSHRDMRKGQKLTELKKRGSLCPWLAPGASLLLTAFSVFSCHLSPMPPLHHLASFSLSLSLFSSFSSSFLLSHVCHCSFTSGVRTGIPLKLWCKLLGISRPPVLCLLNVLWLVSFLLST